MDKIEDMIAACSIRRVEAISPGITLERYANPQTGEQVERLTVCRKEP